MINKKAKGTKKMGRKRLINGEKKHLIQVFVKAKHYASAKKEIFKIAGKHNSKKDKAAV